MLKVMAILVGVTLIASLQFVGTARAVSLEDGVEAVTTTASEKAEELRKKKDERIAEIKQQVEARKIELQKEKCEARQTKLEELLPRLSNGATTIKTTIDKNFERAKSFYESGKLTVDNYDQLVNAIDLAKGDAEDALAALETYPVEVNCADASVGQQLDTYRTAVKEVRDSLKAYRTAVVDLISALKAELEETVRNQDATQTGEAQ